MYIITLVVEHTGHEGVTAQNLAHSDQNDWSNRQAMALWPFASSGQNGLFPPLFWKVVESLG